MNFELEYLWNLFNELSVKQPSDKQSQAYEKEVNSEKERLQKIFLYHSPHDGLTLKAFIQFHQHGISRLLSAVEQVTLSSNDIGKHPKSYEMLAHTLDELLKFLQFNFPAEFDFCGVASASYIIKQMLHQRAGSEMIRIKMSEISVRAELQAILLDALNLADRKKMTFADIRYILKLTETINEKLEELTSQSALEALLSNHNFNNLSFYNHLRQKMNADFESCLAISEKYKMLIVLKRELEQGIPQSSEQYSAAHPDLKVLINEYLESERIFTKELDFLTTELVNSGLLDTNYKVSFTVKQLAFYIYLNVESGIITEQRAKKIHQYVISHVDSQEKSGIAEKSFKNAYYQHHAEDIRKVCEKIAKMLAIARERF